MALVRNGRTLHQNPGTFQGSVSGQPGNTIKGGLRNRFFGVLDQRFAGYPNGSLAPQSFIMPQEAGSIASINDANLAFAAGTVTLTPGAPMIASSAMAFAVANADLDQIVALVASGVLSMSAASAGLSAATSMTATGDIFMAQASAILGGIIPVTASGTIAMTPSVTMTALAFMEAEAGGPTPLSPEGLAQAVWSALIADYAAEAGTTGEALANAGGAGNPWDALLAANADPGTFGEHVQKLLKATTYLGTK